MKENKNIDDVLFMSSAQFKFMTDVEAFVFSHVAFFACQSKYNRTFKQSTQAICNKTCYTQNTVRSALQSLVKKGFLKYIQTEPESQSYPSYYENISHKMTVGDHEFARTFAVNLSRLLTTAKSKLKSNIERDISFFKVQVGKLKNNEKLCRGNLSKHSHKTLIIHGYLYNQYSWDMKKERHKPSRTVSYLSHAFNFSCNTVRRIINTLSELDIVEYDYKHGLIKFNRVNDFDVTLRLSISKLKTKLISLLDRHPKLERNVGSFNSRTLTLTPSQAAENLRAFQRKYRG